MSASGISRADGDSSFTNVSSSPIASRRSSFCAATSRSMRLAIWASSALRRCSGMRGPNVLPELFVPDVAARRSALRPTAPPTIARSAAGLTVDFSDAMAGVSALGAGFLSAAWAGNARSESPAQR
jgi:hypothetical protein